MQLAYINTPFSADDHKDVTINIDSPIHFTLKNLTFHSIYYRSKSLH